MRIIATNATDIATVAVTTASVFSSDNVKNDFKSSFHRSGGATPKVVTYNLTWTTAQTIGGVCLPCTNLSASATILVQLYSDTGFTTPISGGNSGTIDACKNSPIANLTSVAPTGNLFQLGVLSKTSVWFPSNIPSVLGMKITLNDNIGTNNPAGFIDCARIVCGSYWQPSLNASREGLDVSVVDTSSNTRTDAGDLVTDRGFINDELSLNLSLLTDTDRNNLLQIIRSAGTNKNILVSVFPTDYSLTASNTLTEQHYTVYGKRANSQFNYIIQGYGSSNLQITGW